MRFFSLVSSSLILLGLSGTALAKAPSRSFLQVGTFSPHSAKSLGPTADDATYNIAARSVLAEQAPWSTKLSLGEGRTATLSDGRKVVKFEQKHAGLPVMGRGATVTFGSDGLAHLIAQKLDEELPGDVTPAVDVETAAKTASQLAGVDIDARAGRLVIWPTANGNVLAWHFYQPIRWAIPYSPAVIIDAKTGDVLVHYNATRTIHQAKIYPTNPTKSPGLQAVTLPLPDGATTLSSPLVYARNCIDKKTTKNFMGFPIHVCELLQTATADAGTLDFSQAPAMDTAPEDPFAELHIFAHTQKAYDFFRGFQANFTVQSGPIDAVANLRIPQGLDTGDITKLSDPNLPLQPFQNAFFTPGGPQDIFTQIFGITGGGAMMFGQGPAKDYSYDGDVIYHEFTHAVVDATIQLVGTPHNDAYGIVMSPGAMNEGLADFFSSAIAGDPDVGEYAVQDFDPSLQNIRSLANPDTCPGSIGGEVHQDATLFSGGLWDVRKNLSAALQDDFDKAVFSALVAAPSGDLNFDELANIIIEQVKAVGSLGAGVGTQLNEAWTKRGVFPQCTRILTYAGTTLQGPLAAGNGYNVWFGPGKQSANLGTNPLGYVPGVIQVKVDLPANTDSISVQFEGATPQTGLGGGMGTFAPKVLVRFGADPIQFTYSPFATTADVVTLSPNAAGQQPITYDTTTPVMPGTTTAYVMIANAGDADGVFTNLNITTTQSASVGVGTGAGGGGGAGGEGGSGTGANSDGPVINDNSSCSCSTPGGSSTPASLGLVALAAAAGLFARRRRS